MLVLHFGALGDCVLAIHVADAIRSAGCDASLIVAARSSIARWAAARGIVTRSAYIDALSDTNFDDALSTVGLSGETVGRVICFTGHVKEAWSSRLTGRNAPSVFIVDPRVRDETDRVRRHIVQQWMADLARQGCETDEGRLGRLQLSPDTRERIRRTMREKGSWTGRPGIVIHPGSGGLHKCLPIDALVNLARALQAAGAGVVWMIGPDEVERFGNELAERLGGIAPVVFEEDPGAAADIVAGADAFVGYDAGMTHVAALAGVRTFALFVATDPRVWGPIGVCVQELVVPRESNFKSWADGLASRILGDVERQRDTG